MLEENTECWICKRTEGEIIAEIKTKGYSESIIDEIQKDAEEQDSVEITTQKGVIHLESVNGLGYSYPICAICAGLVWTISLDTAREIVTLEIEDRCPFRNGSTFQIKEIEKEYNILGI